MVYFLLDFISLLFLELEESVNGSNVCFPYTMLTFWCCGAPKKVFAIVQTVQFQANLKKKEEVIVVLFFEECHQCCPYSKVGDSEDSKYSLRYENNTIENTYIDWQW